MDLLNLTATVMYWFFGGLLAVMFLVFLFSWLAIPIIVLLEEFKDGGGGGDV